MISVLVVDDDFMVARVHQGVVSRVDGFAVVGTRHTGADGGEGFRAEGSGVEGRGYTAGDEGSDGIREVRSAGDEVGGAKGADGGFVGSGSGGDYSDALGRGECECEAA